MSEIIASVYEKIEETGVKEGILFIDEINCVSETLAPAMLQFLQCKTCLLYTSCESYDDVIFQWSDSRLWRSNIKEGNRRFET